MYCSTETVSAEEELSTTYSVGRAAQILDMSNTPADSIIHNLVTSMPKLAELVRHSKGRSVMY